MSRRISLFCSVARGGRGCSRWILPKVKKLYQVMPWGSRMIWVLIFLLCFSVASGFTNTESLTTTATKSSTPGISSTVPTTIPNQESPVSSTFGNISLYAVSQDSSGNTAAISGKECLSQAPEGCCWHLGKALGYLQIPPPSISHHRWKHTSHF